jgi:inner membrane protein
MLTITHLLVGAASVGMAAQTTNPVPILIGAIASLLPDIDISTSPAGRVLPFISRPLEQRFSHRSATHSLLASFTLALVSYALWFAMPVIPLVIIHALNIGYFAGWFLDCFTKSGVEMFYPLGVRCVCPGNRNLRISTGSAAEYWLMVFVVAIAKRDKQRLEIAKVSYRFGEGDSERYLAQLSSYDRQKAATFREWSRLRNQVVQVKLLVLGTGED